MFSSVPLDFQSAMASESAFERELRKQIRQGLRELDLGAEALARAVYVIRMTGAFLIAYKHKNSPVLYIGQGSCENRLIHHLKRWLSEVHSFGANVGIEIRVACPRRRNYPLYYKHVEADLIYWFAEIHGSIPFFNKRFEIKYEDRASYTDQEYKDLMSAIGIGSGRRPQWALKPTRANKAFSTFLKGEHFEE